MKEDIVCFGLIGLVLLAALADGYARHQDRLEWEKFRAAHECKVVAHLPGDVFNTIGSGANGQVTVGIGSTPDKTGWLCNDGITYFREGK